MARIDSFEEFDSWKGCRKLRLFIHEKVLSQLLLEEKFSLSDQLIRAARSTTAIIAEGLTSEKLIVEFRPILEEAKALSNDYAAFLARTARS